MAKPYVPTNEVQSTLASAWTRGTSTSMTLADGSDFDSGGGYVRVGDATSFALMEYTGKTGADQLDHLAAGYCTLGVVVSTGDTTKEWAIGTEVSRVVAGEDVADRTNIVYDTTPQLGGNLDVNAKTIVSASNNNIPITPNGTGRTIISAPSEIVTSKTAIATLTVAEAGIVLVSCAVTPYTITLPTASGNAGLFYRIIKTDANYNLITLDGNGAETFNFENATGAPVTTYTRLNTYCAEVTVISDGTNWQCINEQIGQIPTASVYLSGNQDNLTHSQYTVIEFDTENYDIGSNFNTGTYKYVIPIGGTYQIIFGWILAGPTVESGKRYNGRITEGAATSLNLCFLQSSSTDYLGTVQVWEGELDISDEITGQVYNAGTVSTVDLRADSQLIVSLLHKD